MTQSWIFSIITPVFSVTWSSEIILICWFAAQETFIIYINVKNCLIILVETMIQENRTDPKLLNCGVNSQFVASKLSKLQGG